MTTITEVEALARKIGSDVHHLSERVTEHIASKKGCSDKVDAIGIDLWGNGKPGLKEDVSEIRTSLVAVDIRLKEANYKIEMLEKLIMKGVCIALGGIVTAVTGLGIIVFEAFIQH